METMAESGEHSRLSTAGSSGVQSAKRALKKVAPLRGIQRVRETLIFAFQSALAAALSWWVATAIFDHRQAFFAPIAAVISLGVSGGKRIRRGFELTLGATLGVATGDLVVRFIGSGTLQLALVVFLAILVGTFVDGAVMVSMQAASSAVLLTTIMAPGSQGVWTRAIDALIGGLIGILVLTVVPNSPLRPARREVSTLMSKVSLVLDDVAKGMEARNGAVIGEALREARGTQTNVNAMLSAAKGGSELVSLSPIYWTAKRHANSMARILTPVDNLMRNARVLARRAEVMIEDEGEAPEGMIDLIRDLSNQLGHLGALYATGGTRGTRQEAIEIPEIVRNLQLAGAAADPILAKGTGLSGAVIIGQCRSIIVDALQICGYSHSSAMAALVPTVETPWVEPEVWRSTTRDATPKDED